MRPSRSPAALADVARRLEAGVHDLGRGGPPLLVGLADDHADGPRPSPMSPVGSATDDPVADLLGYVVPSDCSGLAVVSEGVGRRMVEDHLVRTGGDPPGPLTRGEPIRCRLAYVLDRSGRAGAALRQEGGEAVVDGYRKSTAGGPTGRLVDVCHRTLRLPTRPAPSDTAELWLLSWLDLLLARALGADPPRSWAEAARAHPAVRVVDAAGAGHPEAVRVRPAELGRLGLALGRTRSWGDLRRAAAAGEWSAPGLPPRHAGWMDDGMFARWVAGEFLPVPLYLEELDDALPGAVARGIELTAASVTGRRHRT